MPEPGNRTDAEGPRSPWLHTGFVLAAAFVGFVTVIGIVVAVTSGERGDRSAPAPTAMSTARSGADAGDPGAPSASGEPAGGGAQCPALSDASRDLPDSTLKGVTWDLYHSVALPRSKDAGPAVVEGDVLRCYAHTPLGALLATSQISVRYLTADDWLVVTRTQTVGAGRDAYIAGRTKAERSADPDPDTGPAGEDDAGQGQIAGFRFVTYHDTTAVIQTVWRSPGGQLQAATTTVLWKGGDWRLEYPADPPDPAPVDSLAGYTPWGGV
ncbi:hypothetical protein ACIBL8_45935 [Streptomyces sp. NPDC050523]|uniref:hypothetical protein n=1 Tax=Streptomyces sp. NPDC050523 TaxID=3365622 RepID=UPI0037AF3495